MMNTRGNILALSIALVLFAGTLARAQEEEEMAPLDGVIADMQVAGGRLGKMLTDKPTQLKEKEAIDKLEALIKILEERRRQNGGQSSANPDRPAEDSIIKAGPGGSGPLHDANRKGRGWGQLPAHKRQQILQSMTEGFPPHYQQLLERYYRRLAEEKPAGESPDEAAGAAGPAGKKSSAIAMDKSSAREKSPVAPVGTKAPAEQATP
jgi:hypothetical protein